MKIVEVEEEEAERTTETRTETESVTTAESGGNPQRNAEGRPSGNAASVPRNETLGEQRSDADAERTGPEAAERVEEQTEEVSKVGRIPGIPSGSGGRVKPGPQPELPGFVVKAKDEASKLYALGRYAESMEKYSEIIDVLSKGQLRVSTLAASRRPP